MESLDTAVSELEPLINLGDLRVYSPFPLLSQFLQEVSPLGHQEPSNLNPINPIELLETSLPQLSTTEFSVITEDYLRLNGVGDFQGAPLDPSDDALIYAEDGFTFNGRPTLPVQRDEQGDPVTDARNRPILVENAVAVAEDYSRAKAPHAQYSNLIPPSIVEELTVEVPSFQQLKDQALARRQSEDTTAISFDPNTHPLNHYWDWQRFFPSGGTAEDPLWVQVEGNLNIPPYVDLAHTVLVVEKGQINFKGWGHDLTNVGIITNGHLNLSGVDATDTTILAAGNLNFNGSSQWEGDNLVAGDRVRFNGLTKTPEETDTLNVVAQNRLAFNGYSQLQGRVVSGGRLRFNGLTSVEGVIASQGPLTFNGRATISAVAFPTPPVLTANLANDTGSKADDGITFDPTIQGQVQDDSELVRFEGYLGENSPVDLLGELDEAGNFTLEANRLATLNGGSLEDGTYTLTLVAEDAFGNGSNQSLSFTLDTQTPALTVTNPTDGGIVRDEERLVGTVSGTGSALNTLNYQWQGGDPITVTVNETGAFEQELDLTEISNGSQTLILRGKDMAGNQTEVTQRVEIEQQIPQFAPVDPLKVKPGDRLEVPLTARDPNGDRVTFLLASEGALPTTELAGNGTLTIAPTPEEIGEYDLTLVATDGAYEDRQTVPLEVTPDPVGTTRLSGVILNTNEDPLGGIRLTLGDLETTTESDGSFTLETSDPLEADTLKIHGEELTGEEVYPFIAEKLPLVLGREVYEDVNNVITRPIYLPPLDVDSAVPINPSQDTTVTTDGIPGAAVFVEAGSLENQQGEIYTGELSITEVPVERTPAALPETLHPELVVTIQPGEMVFTTPAPLTLPNREGYAPGSEMNLWSINPNTGRFDNVGTGRVSDDGTVIETIEGGIINSSWHFFTPPPPEPDPPEPDDGCDSCEAGGGWSSEVRFDSGAVRESHDLVSYQSLNTQRGLTLTYDSLRANPQPIFDFGYQNLPNDPEQQLIAQLSLIRGNTEYQISGYAGEATNLSGGEHFWSLPEAGSTLDAALQADLRTQPSGRYEYQLTTGIRQANNFAGSSTLSSGEFVHVNSIDSPFGSGWGLSDWQQLVDNPDDSVLLIDGDGEELLFESAGGGAYSSPGGDFSILEQLSDGTFQRTLRDETVYQFNEDNQLASVTDANGNQTQYGYDEQNHLIEIIDPVGLVTTFSYTDERVSAITDPAGRTTEFDYDIEGNLIQITNPDGSSRRWDYNPNHLITTEVDERGNQEETFYDFAGRATKAVRKDGSTVAVNPAQTQGVLDAEATIDPNTAPTAPQLSETPSVTYTDGNGNVTTTQLDAQGQLVAANDGVGAMPTVERNDDNLVTERTDARGNSTFYEYDEQGNVTRISEEVSVNRLSQFSFAEESNYSLQASSFSLALGDLDNDGNLDVVSGNDDGTVSVVLGKGDGTFDVEGRESLTLEISKAQVALADLDGNDTLDLVVAGESGSGYGGSGYGSESGRITIFSGEGDGSFVPIDADELGSLVSSLALEDLDEDGTPDLVASHPEDNRVSVRLGNGDGTFAPKTDWEVGNSPQAVALGDLDTDGALDVITANRYSDNVSVRLGNGDGTFAPKTDWSMGNGPESVALGDLDHDGALDVVTTNDFDDISVRLGNGDGTFALKTDLNFNNPPPILALQDFNGDQIIDILTGRFGDEVTVFLGEGDGTFWEPRSWEVAETPRALAVGDLDGDGDLDVVSASRSFNQTLSVLENLTGEVIVELPTERSLERHFTYDPVFNQITSMTDELGRQTLYEISPESGNRLSMTRVVGEVGGGDDVITRYTYTDAGLRDTVTDPLGRVTDYDYDAFGRLVQVTFAQGTAEEAVRQYKYDAAGNQTAMIDANGNRTEFEYDAMNRLTRVIEADPNGDGPLTAPVTTYTYDAVGNLLATTDARGNVTQREYDPRNRLTQLIDANGETTTYDYDSSGNLISVIDPLSHETQYEYDARDRRIATVDPEGNRTQFDYDLDNNLTTITDPLGNETEFVYDARDRAIREIDALGNETLYEYDAVNNLVALADRNENLTQYEYDELDRQVQRTNALGDISTTTYDKVGNIIARTDELGRTTNYTYDARDRVTAITNPLDGVITYNYDDVGNLLSLTDELNRTTQYDYDALDRRIEETDPLNYTTSYTYDGVGNLTLMTDARGRTTEYTYDVLNRQIERTNPLGDTATTIYDAAGNVIAQTDELGRTTEFTYDDRNLQTAVTDPLGQTTTTEYDAVGNVITVTDPLGNATGYRYDALYRPLEVTDANGDTTTTTYDPEGNLLSVTDPVGNTTSYRYDALDRQISETNELGNSRSLKYDAVGNLITLTDRNDQVRTFDYDGRDRQIQEQWLDAQGNPIRTIDYSYDAASQLTAVNTPDSSYSYDYDATGRLTTVDNAGTLGIPNVVLDYSYDAVDNLLSVTDTIAGEEQGTETFTYDPLNRVTQITQSGTGVVGKRVEMNYDAASQLTELNRWQESEPVATSNYTYDADGRLTNLVHTQGETTFAEYGLNYDAADRITEFTSPDGISTYTYDNRDQLTTAESDYQADESYSYDENGNRTNNGYVTGENNQLLSDGQYEYEYDAEGNRTKRTSLATGEVTEYQWDYRNRLTQVVTRDSEGTITKQVEYSYDAFDRRISKSVDPDGEGIATPEEEHLLYDRDHIALVFDEGGNLTHRYLHGPQVDQVLAEETGGEVRWALSDHQGTVRDVVNGDGEVLNHLTYDSFGEVTDETNPEVEFRFGYTGREVDPETDLNYYRARYYDPQVGQFISEDPLGFGAGDANLDRYVGNSPTNGTDPYGLQTAYGDDLIPWWATPLVWFGSGLVWVGQQLGDALFDLFENDSITVDPELAELFDPNHINRGEFEIATDLQLPGFGEDSLDFNPNEINFPGEIPDFSDTETFPNSCPALEPPPFLDSSDADIPWLTWDQYPKVNINGREYAQVGGRLYPQHAIDRTTPSGLGRAVGGDRGRSVSPSFIEEVITSPRSTRTPVTGPNGESRTSIRNGSIEVITEGPNDEIVITVITR